MLERLTTAWWGPSEDQSVSGLRPEELDATLDRLGVVARSRPFLVDIIGPDENVLTIGVGRRETVLAFMTGTGDPPYLVSFSADHLVDESVWFDYAGAETEFGPDQVIAMEAGRAVARSFAATGELSGAEWAEA